MADAPSWQRATWRQALSDTNRFAHTVRFWMAEAVTVAVAAVVAVSFYPDQASALEQAGISSGAIVIAMIGLLLIILLANWVVFSARNQRDHAGIAWVEERSKNQELRERALIREQLLKARTQLGNLMSDAGDLLITQYSNEPFLDTSSDFFGRVLDLFRSDTPVFDESHEGRFYAATTKADMESDTNTTEGMRQVLRAEIECLDVFVAEINAELNSLAR